MGRQDPIYSPEAKARLANLVIIDGKTINEAIAVVADEFGETFKYETAKKWVQGERLRRGKAELATDEARASLAALKLLGYVEAQVERIRRSEDPKDVETAGKLAKVLIDLSKLAREKNRPQNDDGPAVEASPLVALMGDD